MESVDAFVAVMQSDDAEIRKQWVTDTWSELRKCNADKRALRQLYEDQDAD